MTVSIHWALAWMTAASLTAVAVTLWDKSRARRHAWRVSESTLWLVAAVGGAVAMYLTMFIVRHKTRHRRFTVGLPLLMMVQAAAVFALWHTKYLIFV